MSTCKIREFLLMTVLMSAFPLGAHAQSYYQYVEHDWRIAICGHSYGLVESVFAPPTIRTTTISFGRHTFTTKLRAPHIAALAAVSFGSAGLLLLTRAARKE